MANPSAVWHNREAAIDRYSDTVRYLLHQGGSVGTRMTLGETRVGRRCYDAAMATVV